jgi:hypothetical protein
VLWNYTFFSKNNCRGGSDSKKQTICTPACIIQSAIFHNYWGENILRTAIYQYQTIINILFDTSLKKNTIYQKWTIHSYIGCQTDNHTLYGLWKFEVWTRRHSSLAVKLTTIHSNFGWQTDNHPFILWLSNWQPYFGCQTDNHTLAVKLTIILWLSNWQPYTVWIMEIWSLLASS